jgi:hypothetical protein
MIDFYRNELTMKYYLGDPNKGEECVELSEEEIESIRRLMYKEIKPELPSPIELFVLLGYTFGWVMVILLIK